ncbi:hypothetical protein BYT27DRAFT_7089768 [Phlegmacium glaucopus]|nr:hypothetical protein BYT27DRAFT_7089768 [Phlegmacium glaucopus]
MSALEAQYKTAPASSAPSAIAAITTTTPISKTITTTVTAPSPTPSNCVWEGTAPFCDGKCHTGFTQIKEDNCGIGRCCATGFKVFCCQE